MPLSLLFVARHLFIYFFYLPEQTQTSGDVVTASEKKVSSREFRIQRGAGWQTATFITWMMSNYFSVFLLCLKRGTHWINGFISFLCGVGCGGGGNTWGNYRVAQICFGRLKSTLLNKAAVFRCKSPSDGRASAASRLFGFRFAESPGRAVNPPQLFPTLLMFAQESASVTVDGSLQYKTAVAKKKKGFPCSLERVAARSIAAWRHRKPSLCSQILDASVSIVDERSLARSQTTEKNLSALKMTRMRKLLSVCYSWAGFTLPHKHNSLRGRRIKSRQSFQWVNEADAGPNIVKLLQLSLHCINLRS